MFSTSPSGEDWHHHILLITGLMTTISGFFNLRVQSSSNNIDSEIHFIINTSVFITYSSFIARGLIAKLWCGAARQFSQVTNNTKHDLIFTHFSHLAGLHIFIFKLNIAIFLSNTSKNTCNPLFPPILTPAVIISLQFHFNFSFLTSNSIIYHIPLPRRGNGIWYMMVEVIEVKYNSLQFVLRCWSDRARGLEKLGQSLKLWNASFADPNKRCSKKC